MTQSTNQVALAEKIRAWASELGFQQTGISDLDVSSAAAHLDRWLEAGHHGSMDYMQRNRLLRHHPEQLVAGTRRIISVRMDYLPESASSIRRKLTRPALAYVSRYALGRDYHKLMRKRLQQLADRITQEAVPHGYRVFVDSAPVLEKAMAEKAGLGWIGKHSNLINRQAGSWFFLGEIFTDLPLPLDSPASQHCGSCQACMDICPTRAIIAPYQVDARLCISYLTIESREAIPEHLRPLLGNRIYGCDDCQLVCPWNRYARITEETDFAPRHKLDNATLLELFQWNEDKFLGLTAGSPIRRIGYEYWQRNLAVALGNAPWQVEIIRALENSRHHPSSLVREHVQWALAQQQQKTPPGQ